MKTLSLYLGLAAILSCSSSAFAGGSGDYLYQTTDYGLTATHPDDWNYCGTGNNVISAGPQSPRDIDKRRGTNNTLFKTSNKAKRMNLCNIHYHRNAEHKSAAFSTFVDTGDEHSGWAIVTPASTDPDYRKEHDIGGEGHEIGIILDDTIEVHWVHTSCNVNYEDLDPANGLGSCVTDVCANPQFRVTAQVLEVVDHDADVTTMEEPTKHNGPRVVYTGSTTGPSYNNDHCSPYQVTWDVKEKTATIDAHVLAEWSHEMREHAHGVRELVTRPELLSPIRSRRGH
jgi:hypothetical protein